jgi:iron complex outermembrane receptor protein
MRRSLLSTALTAAFALPATAALAEEASLQSVIVTATRFSEADCRTAANISVISREDIEKTPATNLTDLLATRAGINAMPIYGPLGLDATVDMRGFGSTAGSNTLVLLDGQRISPTDMGTIIWSSIPLTGIERIEVVRGSGTVLYGDGATGGVINIITDKSGKPRASITATTGSFGYRGLDGSFAGGNEHLYGNLFVRSASLDGYRQNSQQDQQAASGRVGLKLERGEVFSDFAVYKESSGLPGNLLQATYENDPRNSRKPYDTQRRDGYRIRPGVAYALSDKVDLETEVSFEHQTLNTDLVSSNWKSERIRDTLSFTPRLRINHGLGALGSETTVGVDYYDAKVTSTNQNGPNQRATQKSSAFYLQNLTNLTSALSLTLGARQQRMKQSAYQDAYPAWFQPGMDGSASRTRSAYDLGLTYGSGAWQFFGKTGTTFRFANLDELFGYDNLAFRPVFAGDLKPQHGRTNEIGARVAQGSWSARAALFRTTLSDEIGYDASAGANVNLDPTRRQGLETEADWKLSSSVSAKVSYTYLDATFRSGAYAGKRVPLAPTHQGSILLTWDGGSVGQYGVLTRMVGKRAYGSDFNNSHGDLAGYATLDLQASWNFKPWTLKAQIANALDHKHAAFAGYSSTAGLYYYPTDGRALFVSGRYDF